MLSFYIAALIVLGIVVTGFFAGRHKTSRSSHAEWGLGGRSFGTIITWFLLGADVYTAYTFLGLTGLAYAIGAPAFFAIPYGTIAYLLASLFLPKLWKLAKENHYLTMADYVKARFQSPFLALLVALTGIFFVIPYIDLQLVGITGVVQETAGKAISPQFTVLISFLLVAGYTFFSGLRAPAWTSVIKDVLIWVVMLFVIFNLPIHWFGSIGNATAKLIQTHPQLLTIPSKGLSYFWFFGAALMSSMVLFMWPHTSTAAFAAKDTNSIRKNVVFIPLYNIILFLITFVGLTAVLVVPKGTPANVALLVMAKMTYGPAFFGVIGGTIALASLVPASIMVLSAANLIARNVYKEFLNPTASV